MGSSSAGGGGSGRMNSELDTQSLFVVKKSPPVLSSVSECNCNLIKN